MNKFVNDDLLNDFWVFLIYFFVYLRVTTVFTEEVEKTCNINFKYFKNNIFGKVNKDMQKYVFALVLKNSENFHYLKKSCGGVLLDKKFGLET